MSVVIVNWNGLAHLKACIASLRLCGHPLELIVVDNGSTDGSLEFLRSQHDVVLVANDRNTGYAPATNAGIARASADLILLLNNDTYVAPGFLAPLIRELTAQPDVAGCQSKLLTFEEPPRIDAYGSYFTWTGFLYHYKYLKPDLPPERPFEIFSAKGAAVLLKRRVLDKVGLFDPDFFAYLEDSDLCWRIWLSGFRVLCVPESIVWHRAGQTASRLPVELLTFHQFKNRLCMLLKNSTGLTLLRVLPTYLAFNLGLIVFFVVRGQTARARGIGRAWLWNLSALLETLRKRRRVQREIRCVPEAILLKRAMRPVRPTYFYYLLTGLDGYRD